MPEISLFLDDEDERSLVKFILSQGGRLVADLRYPSPEYSLITSWDEYAVARTESRLFFVLFDSYEMCPLRLNLLERGHYAGKYYIVQRTGGPTIDLLTCVRYRKDAVDSISDGMLGCYSTYRDTITGDMEKVPEALISQYGTIIRELTKGGKIIKGQSGRKYLIGSHTLCSVKDGAMSLGVNGLRVE